jgi:hypothetical protein
MATADFTIADVLAWARTKPADKHYCYTDSRVCAVAQFGADTGRKHLVGPEGSKLLREWPDLHEAVNPGAWEKYSLAHTFGGLVERLEALCPDTPVTQSNWSANGAYLEEIEQVSA